MESRENNKDDIKGLSEGGRIKHKNRRSASKDVQKVRDGKLIDQLDIPKAYSPIPQEMYNDQSNDMERQTVDSSPSKTRQK